MPRIASRFTVAVIVVVAVASAVYLVRQLIDARQAPAIVISDAAAARPVTVFVDGAVATPGTYTLAPGARAQDALAAAGGRLPSADDSVNPARLLQDGERLTVPTRSVETATMVAPSPPKATGQSDALPITGMPTATVPMTATQRATSNVAAPRVTVEPADRNADPTTTVGRSSTESATTGAVTAPININTASAADLEALPGIGPVLSERIIAYRDEHGPFATVDDLAAVTGISVATVERLRPLVTV